MLKTRGSLFLTGCPLCLFNHCPCPPTYPFSLTTMSNLIFLPLLPPVHPAPPPLFITDIYLSHQLILWRSFYFIAANMAGYDRSRVRLLLSDTDSLVISTSRNFHPLETYSTKRTYQPSVRLSRLN